jgi:hypothetical protein
MLIKLHTCYVAAIHLACLLRKNKQNITYVVCHVCVRACMCARARAYYVYRFTIPYLQMLHAIYTGLERYETS